MLTFDVAPWGEIGNVKVAAAQPSAEFGAAAIQALRAAKLSPSGGFIGCVEVIRFRMGYAENAMEELGSEALKID